MKIYLLRDLLDDEQPILDALPAEPTASTEQRTEAIGTVWGLFEVLLKAPSRLDAFVRQPSLQGKLIVGFSAIVFVGFVLHGLVLSALLFAVPPSGVPEVITPGWARTWLSVLALTLTYPVGLLLTTLLLLPSYYYFAMLGGAQMSLREVLTHSLKGKAATTVLLMGVLPIYAIALVVLLALGSPSELVKGGLYVGLVLPFLLGVRGAQSIFSGLEAAVGALPAKQRTQRYSLPSWLVVLWAALFTATAPLVLYEFWRRVSAL